MPTSSPTSARTAVARTCSAVARATTAWMARRPRADRATTSCPARCYAAGRGTTGSRGPARRPRRAGWTAAPGGTRCGGRRTGCCAARLRARGTVVLRRHDPARAPARARPRRQRPDAPAVLRSHAAGSGPCCSWTGGMPARWRRAGARRRPRARVLRWSLPRRGVVLWLRLVKFESGEPVERGGYSVAVAVSAGRTSTAALRGACTAAALPSARDLHVDGHYCRQRANGTPRQLALPLNAGVDVLLRRRGQPRPQRPRDLLERHDAAQAARRRRPP